MTRAAAGNNTWSDIMTLRDTALILGGWVVLCVTSGAVLSLLAQTLSV